MIYLFPMAQEFSEEDIQKTLNFLRTNHPEVEATRQKAIEVLSGMHSFAQSFVETLEKTKQKGKQPISKR